MPLKRSLLTVFEQLIARKNLYHMRDRRYLSPSLDAVLLEAAKTWPQVLPSAPRTVLDIGAYRGVISTQLARLYHPDFIGLVEPQPNLALQLRGMSLAPRQMVFECALGRKEGFADLKVLASDASSSLLDVAPGCDDLFHRSMTVQRSIEVPVRTLDSVFSETGLCQLDLLKVDVQGYELEIFAGGLNCLSRTRMIVVEVSFFEHYIGQPLFPIIYDFLVVNHFSLSSCFGYSWDDKVKALQCDVVFVSSLS